jgi:PAS domain S-box-containing protein
MKKYQSDSGLHSPALRYGAGVASFAVALLVRAALNPELQGELPFVTFFAGIAGAAWFGGLGPSVVSAVLGFVAAESFFVDNKGTGWLDSPADFAVAGSYFMVAAIIIVIGCARHKALSRAVALQLELDQARLAEMEGRYRGLLEAAPDGMVVVSQGGEIVLANAQAEKQFAYRRGELLGQRVKNLIPEGFAERLVADGLRSPAEALAQQIGTGIELIGRRKDGSEFPIEILLNALDIPELLLVIRDISVRKAAEERLRLTAEELKRSNEELGQFAYVTSHDLQEPLRMVASYMELLSKRYKGKLDSDADEFIAFAVDGATRMQRLIQDLLAYSRIGTRGKELRGASSEDALRVALTNLGGASAESGALVTHDPLPIVQADQMQLIQLFQNLIGNSIKYHGAEVPRIHVSAAKDGEDRWTFSVRDNGMGIDSPYFGRIFGMFQRLHKRGEFAGTGIGLAICKKIVERHGGSISVESKLGQGSTFRFCLTGNAAK